MKRLAVTISLILTVVLALSFFYVSGVASAKPIPPSVQMLSASYGPIQLTMPFPPVETLSFSVAAPAKLEATSENTSNSAVVCMVELDGTVLVSTPSSSPSLQPDLTVTDTIVASGSHTLDVVCSTATLLPFTANGSLSAIITTGL